MEYNIYFLIILVAVVAIYHLDLFSELFNLKALKPELPEEFTDVFESTEHLMVCKLNSTWGFHRKDLTH